jgi:hypothetical protein
MHDAEEISSVIGCICDASLDPALWPGAFKMSCGYAASFHACIGDKAIQITAQLPGGFI